MQFIPYYSKSNKTSQKSKQVSYILFKNIEDRVRIIFGFSLCAIPLQVALNIYFRSELSRLEPLKDSKV